jgi:hypothetical protein
MLVRHGRLSRGMFGNGALTPPGRFALSERAISVLPYCTELADPEVNDVSHSQFVFAFFCRSANLAPRRLISGLRGIHHA